MEKEPLFIAFASQKGGVGKTAFTVLTAGILHYQRGYNVAVVDCDAPQHSITQMRSRDMERIGENDSLKVALYRQHEQLRKLAYPIIESDPENAVADFNRYREEELVARRNCDLRGIHLFWNMIDKRERKETYESWNKVMRASKLHLLETCIPDTKRYNKELSALQGSVFRSTLLPADNRQIKGSGLVELVDEICGITGLGKYSPSPDA